MQTLILQWGLFSFMIGLVLSLPLAEVIYRKKSELRLIFTNPRKLKSAHLDYFTQAFALGFWVLLEFYFKTEFPFYVAIPLIYGAIMNPTILLLEATPFIHHVGGRIVYMLLRMTAPVSLLFSWTMMAFALLPLFLGILLIGIVILIGIIFFYCKWVKKQSSDTVSTNHI